MARILVVHDEEGAREALTSLLRRHGHDVTVPACNRAAVAQALRCEFDVVIATMFMPDIDSLEIVSAAKARRPETRIICLCGGSPLLPDENALQICLALGADVSLRKPLVEADILAVIEGPPAAPPAS